MRESKSGDISLMSPAKTRPQNKFNISLPGENSMLNFLLKEMCQRLQRKCVSEKVWPFQNYQEIQHGLSFLMVREDFWNNVKWNGRIQSGWKWCEWNDWNQVKWLWNWNRIKYDCCKNVKRLKSHCYGPEIRLDVANIYEQQCTNIWGSP